MFLNFTSMPDREHGSEVQVVADRLKKKLTRKDFFLVAGVGGTDPLPCSPPRLGRLGVPISTAGTPADCWAVATSLSPRGNAASTTSDL